MKRKILIKIQKIAYSEGLILSTDTTEIIIILLIIILIIIG